VPDDRTGRTTIHDLLRDARSRLHRLEPEQGLAAQRDGALVIDTRSSDERRRDGVIPGSLHVPLSVLAWRLDPDADHEYRSRHIVDLDQELVLVCAHGYSSSLAAATLQELGFSRATDLVGGFAAWRDAGLPVRSATPIDADAVPGMGDPEAS
jgi:rhodanese-related sulfurtransferase